MCYSVFYEKSYFHIFRGAPHTSDRVCSSSEKQKRELQKPKCALCLFSLFFYLFVSLLKVLSEQIWLDWIRRRWAAPLCTRGESRAHFYCSSLLACWKSGHKLVYAYLFMCSNVWFKKPMAWIHYSTIQKESFTVTSLGFSPHAMFALFIYRWNYPCWLKLQCRHQTQ